MITEFLNTRSVTGAAFCLAREKIKNVFFKDLNTHLINQIKDVDIRTWKGFKLFAFDGTTTSLPASKQIKEHFGIHSKTAKGAINCLAQCLFCVDVLSDYILGYRLDKMAVSEKTMLRKMLPKIQVNSPTIFLLDRGFGYFNTVSQFIDLNLSFCIRMSVSMSIFAQNVMNDHRNDFITNWIPSEKERETARIQGQIAKPISVRVSKVVLPTGEIELLVSNLFDIELIKQKDMKELYFKRWSIEETIKKVKPKMKLEFWGCKKPRGIEQEFLANIFMYNLSCFLGNQAQKEIDVKTQHRKRKYKYNWQNAYRFTRDKMLKLCLKDEFMYVLKNVIRQIENSTIAIIDNRNFPRNEMRKNKSRSYQTYK